MLPPTSGERQREQLSFTRGRNGKRKREMTIISSATIKIDIGRMSGSCVTLKRTPLSYVHTYGICIFYIK